MLEDVQSNTEYVAYAVGAIYERTCQPFPIQGWSQGMSPLLALHSFA